MDKFRSLRKVDLYNTQIRGKGLRKLCQSVVSKSLTELLLGWCMHISPDDFAPIADLPYLRILDLMGTDIGDDCLGIICRRSGINTLDISWCKSLTDRGFTHLASLTAMRKLHVYSTFIADAGLRAICSEKLKDTLEELDIEDSGHISPDTFAVIGKCTKLRILSIKFNKISDTALEAICVGRSKRSLRELNVGYCERLTGVGFIHIRHLSGLRKLHMMVTKVNEEALREICRGASRQTLSDINLRICTRINKRGFEVLTTLPSLQNVNVYCTKICDSLIRQLPSLQ